ncbi:MAG: carboxypeptidase regulatory-like domain-containing protein [Candidatus Nanohaloarchaea archaeon]
MVEEQNGNRVSGATVSADGSTATTNSNGRTSFRLAEGSYRLVASKNDYLPDDRTVNLDSDRTVTLVLQNTEDGEVFAEFDYNPSNPEVDEDIEFDGSISQGDIVAYRWRFGDGTTGNGRNVQHSYSSEGWYNVRLTVEDDEGSTDTRIRTVRVKGEDSESGLLEVNVEDDRNQELENARVTAMALTPNNYAVRSADESDDTERSRSGRSGDYRLGFELDGRDLETFTEYHSGFNRGNWDNIALESSNGDRLIFRYDLAADSRRGTYRKYEASQDIRLSSGEKEVTLILTVNGDEIKKFTSVIDVPDDHDFEAFRDGSRTEYEGRDTRVSSPSLPIYTRYTDDDGQAVFNLPSGRYTVTGSKSGYRPDRRTIDIDEGEDRSIDLTLDRLDDEDDDDDIDDERQADITSIQLPASVCGGETLNARVQVENTGERGLSFTLSASGLGTETDRTYYLDEGDEDTKIVSFSNVQGSGNQRVSFSTGYDSEERTVQVRNCETEETGGLVSNINPSQIQIGGSIRVNGIVEGTGIQQVQIDIAGRNAQSLSTQPDGRFSTYVYPNRVGDHNLIVRSGERSNTHSIRVIPTVTVSSVNVPNNIFEGDDFEVCGNVESQTSPLVLLKKNGDVVDSKNGKGEVCFERNEKPGEITYQIQALNRGASDTVSRTVEILEQDSEVRNFPNQIASVESGSGMVKVELYNNNNELRNYEIELEGLPRTWIAQSRKETVLNSGERGTEYIYFTPKDEGTYEATLVVRADGEDIYSENIDISSGGVDRKESLWTRFKLWVGLR